MSEWQPITTAPKDGERVLIHCSEGVKEAEYWAAGVRGNKGKAFFEAPYYGQDTCHNFQKVRAWMPMPEPPKAPRYTITDKGRALLGDKP